LSETSLNFARALRLISSWSSKMPTEEKDRPHFSNCRMLIVASRTRSSLESAKM
jgi:hypothetical protein